MYTSPTSRTRRPSLKSHRIPNSSLNNRNGNAQVALYKTWFKAAVAVGMLPVTITMFSAKAVGAYKRFKQLTPNNQARALFGKRVIRGGAR
jgi:hypothetical protein